MRFVILLSTVLFFAAIYQQSVNAELDPGARDPIEYHVTTGVLDCSYECDYRDLRKHDTKIKELVSKINTDHGGYARIETVNITPNIEADTSGGSETEEYFYTIIYSLPKN